MSSIPPQAQAKAAILFAVVLIASQIPTTLEEIANPVLRIVIQLGAVLALIGLGSLLYRVQTRPNSFRSLRPQAREGGRYRLRGEDITPDETPAAKKKGDKS